MEDPRIEIKKRFFEVMNVLIAKKTKGAETKLEFAASLNISGQSLYNSEGYENRYITVEMIFYLGIKFNVNVNYIFFGGDLPMFNLSHLDKKLEKSKIMQIRQILDA